MTLKNTIERNYKSLIVDIDYEKFGKKDLGKCHKLADGPNYKLLHYEPESYLEMVGKTHFTLYNSGTLRVSKPCSKYLNKAETLSNLDDLVLKLDSLLKKKKDISAISIYMIYHDGEVLGEADKEFKTIISLMKDLRFFDYKEYSRGHESYNFEKGKVTLAKYVLVKSKEEK